MTKSGRAAHRPSQEHSVPWLRPMAVGIELADEGMRLVADDARFAAAAIGRRWSPEAGSSAPRPSS